MRTKRARGEAFRTKRRHLAAASRRRSDQNTPDIARRSAAAAKFQGGTFPGSIISTAPKSIAGSNQGEAGRAQRIHRERSADDECGGSRHRKALI
jgi:hypothetical protein